MVCKVKVVGVLVVACGLCEFDQLYEYTSFFRVAGVFHAYAFWINSIVSYINKYALASQSGQACPNAYGTFI